MGANNCLIFSLLYYFPLNFVNIGTGESTFPKRITVRIRVIILCRTGMSSTDSVLFKNNLFKKFLRNTNSLNQFVSRSGPTKCRSGSGSKWFAKVVSRRRVGKDLSCIGRNLLNNFKMRRFQSVTYIRSIMQAIVPMNTYN